MSGRFTPAAATAGIPCVTTLPGAIALIRGLEALRRDGAEPRSLQELHALAGATRPVQGRLVVERGATVGVRFFDASGRRREVRAAATPAKKTSTSNDNWTLDAKTSAGVFARSGNGGTKTTVSPTGVIYFQPDGRVTTDGAGATVASRTLTITGVASAISIVGETGYAE